MRSAEEATELLRGVNSRGGLARLAEALGFDAPLPLAPEVLGSLDLGSAVRSARVSRGAGTLRALLVRASGGGAARELVTRIAGRLSRTSPHLLWMLLVQQRGSGNVVLATWSPNGARPRLSALVVDIEHVLPSDAEALQALAASRREMDVLAHARWLETLGRESLTRRFYRTLERLVGELAQSGSGSASADDRAELALLCVSRLLFLSFLQAKGWLDEDHDFLARTFTECMAAEGGYHRRVLQPLFFGTLNTPLRKRAPRARSLGRVPFLNGGLFARTMTERRCRRVLFGDDALGQIFGELLLRYRFSAREESGEWSESAVDPEMLGRVFESLMASRDRRASGAFYTPQALVASITRAALIEALAPRPSALPDLELLLDGQAAPAGTGHAILARLHNLRILDPSCGSGALLVHAMETIADLARRLGDDRPLHVIRGSVLASSIFGVDVNPTAVWLCELRLWLSVVIESDVGDPMSAPPLPNLDHHIRVGDALAGDGFGTTGLLTGASAIAQLRARYLRSTGKRKASLAREIEQRERALAIGRADEALARSAHRRRELLSALRSPDLFGERHRPAPSDAGALERERVRSRELRAERRLLAGGGALPFSFTTRFPDVAARGGFDVVIGNPPWVRLHRIPRETRDRLRWRYEVLARSTWVQGAEAVEASGFAAQVDLAALFLERSLDLLRSDGAFSLLLPAKLWRSLAGGGARRLLAEQARVTRVEDWSEAPPAFDAAVYPSMIVGRRRHRAETQPHQPGGLVVRPASAPSRHPGRRVIMGAVASAQGHAIAVAQHRAHEVLRWTTPSNTLTFQEERASPWIIAPPEVRAAFELLRRAGEPLSRTSLGRPLLGVKCGCNAAFVVTLLATHGRLATVRSGSDVFHVERELLRPLLRGEGVTSWKLAPPGERIIWTHEPSGKPMAQLPAKALAWLTRWRPRLAARSDGRSSAWWSLFRTGGADAHTPRVVWSDFGRLPRAAIVDARDDTVPLNSCYVLQTPDMANALAFAALLNSPVVAAWLQLLAEPARGGYSRFLAWTVALLPVPPDWKSAVAALAPLGDRARRGCAVSGAELTTAVLRAYRVREELVHPLLVWHPR
jgi:hypothetical protein